MKRIVNIVLISIIAILTFTPIIGYFPFFRRTWIFLLLGLLAIVSVHKTYHLHKGFLFLGGAAIIMFLNAFSHDAYYSTINSVLVEISMIVLSSTMFLYSKNGKFGAEFFKWSIYTTFGIVAIETIATFILDLGYPGILRIIFSESIASGERDELLYPYYRMGLSNYVLPHALPMLIPPLIMGIREKRSSLKLKSWGLSFLFFVLLLVWLSGVVTAFLLSLISVIFTIFIAKGKSANIKFFIGLTILILPFFLSDDLTLFVIQLLKDIFSGNQFISYKLEILEESLLMQQSTGDMAERQNLYMISLNEFANNILIGSNNPMGNHSMFLDRLGTLGLVGFIPYMAFYYFQLTIVRKAIAPRHLLYYDQAVVIGLLMMALKGITSWEIFFTLFMVMPSLFIFLSSKNETR